MPERALPPMQVVALQRVIDRVGGRFDVIIDDGGHTMQQQQNTLDVYWPHVKPGSAFIVEDLHTSYMDYYQTPGDRPTVDVLQDSTPEDLDRMRCNFEPGEDWLDPYPALRAKLPRFHPAITAVEGIAGDLLRMAVPPAFFGRARRS